MAPMTRTRIQSAPVATAAPASRPEGNGQAAISMAPEPVSGAASARRPRPLVREDILDAVDDQLERVGYARMTIEEVARTAGVGKGSIYLHFASKEDLALSSIDRLVRRLLVQLAGIADEPGPPVQRLRRMLETRVLFRFDHVRQDAVSLDEMLAVLRGALLQRREEWFERESALLARVIAEGRAPAGGRGLVDAADPACLRAARALVTATNALLPYSLSKAELGRRSLLAERVAVVADLLLLGLFPASSLDGPVADSPPTVEE
jgi:AcrR family transcriptional regulator